MKSGGKIFREESIVCYSYFKTNFKNSFVLLFAKEFISSSLVLVFVLCYNETCDPLKFFPFYITYGVKEFAIEKMRQMVEEIPFTPVFVLCYNETKIKERKIKHAATFPEIKTTTLF